MTIPLFALLAAYGLFLALFAVLSAVDLYHLFRFGSLTFFSVSVTLIYLVGAALLLAGTAALLQGTDWSLPLFGVGVPSAEF